MRYFGFLLIFISVALTASCSGKAGKSQGIRDAAELATSSEKPVEKVFSLTSPDENAELKLHQAVKVVLEPVSKSEVPDSAKIYFDGKIAGVIKNAPWQFTVPSSMTGKTGRKALKIVGYAKNAGPQTITRFLIVYSDEAPKRNGYRMVKTYPHDKDAFTQGLIYSDGILYESTGQEARSSLRKVNLESGQVISLLNLESPLFGEGIAIAGDRIYQLTWQSKVGFVYEKSSFRLLNKIYYHTEGWGLTTIGDKLVMSDGTNNLYFIDPNTFSVVSSIEVYDNHEKVMKLNELEYISGEIWANIWGSDLIARIDPESGKVLAYIDLRGILNDPSVDTEVNVLNGIAYDTTGNRIFVTGKNWPRLFEIKVTE